MFKWFERRIIPYPEREPDMPPKSLVGFCWYYSKDATGWLISVCLMVAVLAVIEVSLFIVLGDLIDLMTEKSPEAFFDEHALFLWMVGGLLLLFWPILSTVHSIITHQTLLGNFPMAIRWMMHRRILRHSMSFFADEFAGRVATKVMQTSLAVRETVMKLLDAFVYAFVQFIATVILLLAVDWRIASIFVIWFAIYMSLLGYFVPKLKNISQEQADARSIMTGRIVDSYTNIATVKLFSHAKREEKYARDSMDPFLETVFRQMRMVTKLDLGVTYNNIGLIFLVGALSIYSWSNGDISIGVIAVGCGLAMRLNGLSHWIMWEMAGFFEQVGVVQDGMNMLTKPIDIVDKPNANIMQTQKGGISFENVRFHYGKESGVIENLSLEIKPGEKIGLVGRSGAGKTTLVNLLLRYFDLESGRILVDGVDNASVTQVSLRAHVGMVSQDTSLLHRSVRDNIAYGKPNASDEEVIRAAKQANAYDFILGLEDKYGRTGLDAHVGERGVKLSGGQRQRIAIARVFLKDAPILVLDEATSALDSEVEQAIQENLFSLMEGKTVIAIAHRLSTISEMDRLIVLDKGAIVEEGNHERLVAAGGLYADLWSRQSGGFIETEQKTLEAGE